MASILALCRRLSFHFSLHAINVTKMSPLFPLESGSAPKVIVSLGSLPGYVVPAQAPTKRAPWRTIRGVSHGDSATVVLPDDLYRIIWDSVEADVSRTKFAKVIMKLEEVLKGSFFNEYIKKGGFNSVL